MTDELAVSKAEALQVYGRPGLSVFGGLINEEYLTEIKSWTKLAKIYREMADYPVVGTLLDAIKAPLLAAEFTSSPASDSEGDQKAADFLTQVLHGMHRQTWRSDRYREDQLEYRRRVAFQVATAGAEA